MSYVFDANDETVWSPALQVGRLYVTMARALADDLGIRSGLIADAEDLYDIDPSLFPHFVYQVAESEGSGHPVYHSLVRGFVATSLVMMERAGIGEDVITAIGDRFGPDMAVMRKSMPA